MKKFCSALITVVVLLVSNIILSKLLNISFLELSFVTGLVFSLIVGFFTSEGGALSEIVDYRFKFLMEKEARQATHYTRFYMNIPLMVCICYMIIFGIVNVVMYWKYFV